jgi:hypothetical protein
MALFEWVLLSVVKPTLLLINFHPSLLFGKWDLSADGPTAAHKVYAKEELKGKKHKGSKKD